MRTLIPLIALSLSALLFIGCPPADSGDSGTGASGGDGTGASGGDGTGGTGGDGTGGTGGGGTGGDGTGGSTGDACGAGTACSSDDGDSGEWCANNVCGSPEDVLFAFCNDFTDNPNADGEFGCGCFTGECSRTPENDCFAATDCDPSDPDSESFCLSVCASECGGPNEWRDGFCQATGPDTGFCECFCADGTGTCFD